MKGGLVPAFLCVYTRPWGRTRKAKENSEVTWVLFLKVSLWVSSQSWHVSLPSVSSNVTGISAGAEMQATCSFPVPTSGSQLPPPTHSSTVQRGSHVPLEAVYIYILKN